MFRVRANKLEEKGIRKRKRHRPETAYFVLDIELLQQRNEGAFAGECRQNGKDNRNATHTARERPVGEVTELRNGSPSPGVVSKPSSPISPAHAPTPPIIAVISSGNFGNLCDAFFGCVCH